MPKTRRSAGGSGRGGAGSTCGPLVSPASTGAVSTVALTCPATGACSGLGADHWGHLGNARGRRDGLHDRLPSGRPFLGCGMQFGESRLRHSLRIECNLGCNLGCTHCDARFFRLHLAVGGCLGITCGHAGCSLRGAACANAGRLRTFFGGRLGSAALMGRKAPIDFFFPLGRKVRLCAQSSKSPFGAALFTGLPATGLRRWVGLARAAILVCRSHREPQTLLSMEVGDRGCK